MIKLSRNLEASLGSDIKKIEDNEKETVILQRRAIRFNKDIAKNEIIKKEDLSVLRPCPIDALPIYDINKIIGKKSNKNFKKGEYIKKN